MPRPPKSERPRPKRTADGAVKIVERIKQAIYEGEFPPGTPLREKRLSQDWKVGMTPLREAVRLLAAKGFLVLRPNQAPLVRKFSPADIQQIYEVRELLEVEALRRAWPRITPEDIEDLGRYFQLSDARQFAEYFKCDEKLHGLWSRKCGNKWLAEAIENVLIYRPTYGRLLSRMPDLIKKAIEDHRLIYEALLEGRLELACANLRDHIRSNVQSIEIVLHLRDSQPPVESPPPGRSARSPRKPRRTSA